MAGMGEILSTLRKQKGVTQEEMGKALGVSMQAVSRWENGGAPDIMLLPALADYFSVSIDELFGREGGTIPAEAAILKRLSRLPQESRIEEAFRLCWEIQRGLSSETDFHSSRDQEMLREYMEQSAKRHSRVNCDGGLTEFGLGRQQNWCFLSPEPEDGRYAALYDRERHTKLFALLAQPDAYDALFLVLGRDQNPFTAKLLEKALRIPQERATEILDAFVTLPFMSISLASTTFVGQNIGAQKWDRVKKSARTSFFISTLITIVISALIYVFGSQILSVFTSDEEVIRFGTMQLQWMAPFYVLCGFSNVCSGVIRGSGETTIPMLIMVFNFCVLRVIWLSVMPMFIHDITIVFLSYIVTWTTCAVMMMIYYKKGKWLTRYSAGS